MAPVTYIVNCSHHDCQGSTKMQWFPQVHADESQGAGIINFVQSALGGQLKEARLGSARFVLGKSGQTMSEVFRILEDAKSRIGIHEYGLSQPSLEQVFLTVVGSQ